MRYELAILTEDLLGDYTGKARLDNGEEVVFRNDCGGGGYRGFCGGRCRLVLTDDGWHILEIEHRSIQLVG